MLTLSPAELARGRSVADDGGAAVRPPADPWVRADAACAQLPGPLAILDRAALSFNAGSLLRRAGGKTIRVATKSIRSRGVLAAVLAQDGFAGLLAYTLPEALWLAADPSGAFADVLVGYPTADAPALRVLAGDDVLRSRVTLMVDSVEQLEWMEAVLAELPVRGPLRVALELDASYRPRLGWRTLAHIGVRRSPVRTAEDAAALAFNAAGRTRRGTQLFTVVGLMAYEAQVAGLPDHPANPAKAAVLGRIQAASMAELANRRRAVAAAVGGAAELEFVNGGGTGSLELTAADTSVTELAAGSGLFGPTLFDHYSRFSPAHAVGFALPVVRRPGPGMATVLGGGWIASGPTGPSRAPTPVHPAGLALLAAEGAGEVQTPLRGSAADALRIGDKVWFRHGKSGEVCEHVDGLHVLDGGRLDGTVATYRGEGKAFL
ncbi:alanine racemase [Arthrobacter sp. 35W]|uniref:alanine racemase n=1 Tax=Arthrobacter sp. 35W TaxID=1132441 RepID=UPI000403995B|nr:alanine racemase [Arthrobacter sp. 35W]